MENSDYNVPRTLISYDGELIGGADAMARYRRDEELETKYEEAEAALDSEQMTWDDVAEQLRRRLYK